MRFSDWSSDVCSSDLHSRGGGRRHRLCRNVGLQSASRGDCAGRCKRPVSAGPRLPRAGCEPACACRRIAERRRCGGQFRSEEHTSELQSLMRISYAVFCLKKKKEKLANREKKRRYRREEYSQ